MVPPDATTAKLAELPTQLAKSTGWVVMAGGVFTVMVLVWVLLQLLALVAVTV